MGLMYTSIGSVLEIVLYEPEIPPNTGNVIRLAANTGAKLALIGPLGFDLSDAKLRRAGLDYHEWADIAVFESLGHYLEISAPSRLVTFSTKATRTYTDFSFAPGDALMFGPETRGLPDAVRCSVPEACQLCIPMRPNSRSLNLSNAVAVAVFEAWRQLGFAGGAQSGRA